MKKTHFKRFFVIINTTDFSIRVTSKISTMASIVGISNPTAGAIDKRTTHKGFIIIPTIEE